MFLTKLKKLAAEAFQGLDEVQLQPIIRDAFLFGLRPEIQKETLSQEVPNLNAAVTAAQRIENRNLYYFNDVMSNVQTNNIQKIGDSNTVEKRLDRLEHLIERPINSNTDRIKNCHK